MKNGSWPINTSRCSLLLIGVFATASISAFGQSKGQSSTAAHQHRASAAAAADSDSDGSVHPLRGDSLLDGSLVTNITIPDIRLTNQDHQQVSLYRGLMKNKLVVLNFFYTSCTSVCPTTGLWISRLQNVLGPRLGKDVVVVSISIDPVVDTPAKLKQWSSHWKRRLGWSLLTSRREDARALIKQFLQYEAAGSHSPAVYVGDGKHNTIGWVKVDILNQGEALLEYFKRTSSRFKSR